MVEILPTKNCGDGSIICLKKTLSCYAHLPSQVYPGDFPDHVRQLLFVLNSLASRLRRSEMQETANMQMIQTMGLRWFKDTW